MSKSKSKNPVKVVQNALRVVEIDQLNIDRSYQRGLAPSAKKIAADYDHTAFGIPLVGQRSDDSLWIVDGQQRIEGLKIKGNQKWVRCEVFASEGPEHEARIFKLVNKNRTQLKPLQLFHAMLVAQDEHCWKLKEIIEAAGFEIPKGESRGKEEPPEKRAKRMNAINALSRILVVGGEDALKWVLDVVAKVWPEDPQRVKHPILGGLFQFWSRRKGEVDADRLIPRLMTTTPAKILYSAGLGVSDALGNVADIIEKVYRKKLQSKGV